jgi:hypothetical protein
MAAVHEEELVHPTQASRVRLRVFEQLPGGHDVAGLGPHQAGFLVTEERIGARTVFATLGYDASREEALARVRERAAELVGQSYRPRSTPAA